MTEVPQPGPPLGESRFPRGENRKKCGAVVPNRLIFPGIPRISSKCVHKVDGRILLKLSVDDKRLGRLLVLIIFFSDLFIHFAKDMILKL